MICHVAGGLHRPKVAPRCAALGRGSDTLRDGTGR